MELLEARAPYCGALGAGDESVWQVLLPMHVEEEVDARPLHGGAHVENLGRALERRRRVVPRRVPLSEEKENLGV